MGVRLALATGARRGEVLGLTWDSFDARTSSIRINQQQTKSGLRAPKTERGKRTITLDGATIERLAEWKSQQAEYLFSFGIRQTEKTPIVSDELGGFLEPDNFSRWWDIFRKRHGFDTLKLHDLRHTQATLLIAQGVDIKTVQNRLGHTKASTTLDLYAGVLPGKDAEAASVIGSLLTTKKPIYGETVNL
ncbi:MAG: site-specific integrase [Coriobacteriia bacterium]|nr:site-specific integrase [Coriobacteriia bacterium]